MKKIFVAGHRGMVGSAIVRSLQQHRDVDLILRSREQLDLTSQVDVADFFASTEIDAVVLAAAKVGGIHANNSLPADFIYQNLLIQANVIHHAYVNDVARLLLLGSSCIYPVRSPQPMSESHLLTGPLEPTNEPYAVAKIAGIKLCESYNRQYGTDFRSVMPTNLYGPGDNFHETNSHVVPALIRRFHEATIAGSDSVTIWGTGSPKREFMYVEDMAEACLKILSLSKSEYESVTSPMLSHINIGTGEDHSIADLARLVAEVTGFSGEIIFDADKPDGAPRKLLDVSKLGDLGWRAKISLRQGLKLTYDWYRAHAEEARH